MELVIGGKNQGKLEYVLKEYSVEERDVFFAETDDLKEMESKKVLYGFHILVRRWLKEEISGLSQVEKLNFDFIISDEIGNGIVPIDKFEREWREETGRCCCVLAKNADRVVRVFSGIPVVIK